MLVRFVKTALPYAAGEVADFDERRARDLIDRGVAAPHKTAAQVDRRSPEPITRSASAPTDTSPSAPRRGRGRPPRGGQAES